MVIFISPTIDKIDNILWAQYSIMPLFHYSIAEPTSKPFKKAKIKL